MLLLRYPQLPKDNLLDGPSHQDQTAIGHVDQCLKSDERITGVSQFYNIISINQ